MSKILSIEINNEIIKIVEGSKSIKGEFVSINKCLSVNIPPESIDDGRIINMDSIKLAIEKALEQNNIKTKNAIFIINTNTVIIRKIELPMLKRKSETISMIKLEIEQMLPENLDQMIIFKMDKMIDNACSSRMRYIVYCLSLDVHDQYIKLSEMLRIKLLALDISSNFLENVPKMNLKINDKVYFNDSNAFINLEYNKIGFCVLDKCINVFSRVIYLNHNEEEMYQACKIAENSNDLCNSSIINAKDKREFDVNQWLNEISKYIRYYYSIEKDNIINKIYIYGTCYEIEGFEQYLSTNLNIEVETIKEISNLEYIFLNNEFNINEYFDAVLALFSDKNHINFLTDKIKYHKLKFNAGFFVMTASLFLILTGTRYTQSYLVKNEALKKEIKTMNLYVNNKENINFNNEVEGLKNNIACLEEEKERMIKIKDIIKAEDAVSSQLFTEIMYAKPLDTKIIFITVDKDNIHIQCKSPFVEDTMIFLKNLRIVNFIDNIYMPSIETKQEGEYKYSFSLICKLRKASCNESE